MRWWDWALVGAMLLLGFHAFAQDAPTQFGPVEAATINALRVKLDAATLEAAVAGGKVELLTQQLAAARGELKWWSDYCGGRPGCATAQPN